MKSSAVAVLVVFFLAACGTPAPTSTEPGIVHEPCAPLLMVPSASATDAQREGLEHAAALWNMMGFTRLVTHGDGEAIAVHFEDAAPFFHGYYDPKTGEVSINNDLGDPGELGVVIAHELGHAMGLAHVMQSERVSVMNPGNLASPPDLQDNALLSLRCSK